MALRPLTRVRAFRVAVLVSACATALHAQDTTHPATPGRASAPRPRAAADTISAAVAAVGAGMQGLADRLVARIADVPDAGVAVAVRDLATGAALDVNGRVAFHAASTMKIPVLIQLWRDIDAGRLRTDATTVLTNRFVSIVDGSPYALSAGDDSDSLVYAWIGDTVPLLRLAERMITHSSNLATNVLVAALDPVRITRTTASLGAPDTRVLRGVEDGPAYRAGRNNVTTAADLAALLVAIERGGAASPAGTVAMRRVLLSQAFNDEIPAGLPAHTPVAHKTGQITATLHDAAIVYAPARTPFVLVVLTRDIPDPAVARRLIADLARITWDALVPDRPADAVR